MVSSKRKALAAIMLLRLGDDRDTLADLDDPENPEALFQFAAAVRDYGLKPADLEACLHRAQDKRDPFHLAPGIE